MNNYETKAGDNKEEYVKEKKIADEVEAELLSRQRKVYFRDPVISIIMYFMFVFESRFICWRKGRLQLKKD